MLYLHNTPTVNSPTRNHNLSCIASNPPVPSSIQTSVGTRTPKGAETLRAVTSNAIQPRSNPGPNNSNRSCDSFQANSTVEERILVSLRPKPCELHKQASKQPATHPIHEMVGGAHQHQIPKPHQTPSTPGTHARTRKGSKEPRGTHRAAVGRRGAATSALLVPLERRPRHRRGRHPRSTRGRRRLRSAAPALRPPLHWIRGSRSRGPPPPPIWRASERGA